MRVFWTQGYAGASISDLTTAMGIASPSLYAAFGSKEGLYREALALYMSTRGDTFQCALTLPTARGAIETLLRGAVLDFTSGEYPAGCMLVLTGTQTADMSPELAAEMCDQRASGPAAFVTRLEQAVTEGEIAPGTDIKAVADFYTTIHRGLTVSARGGATYEELDSVVTSAMAAWGPLTTIRSEANAPT
ncbi:TetR/AcrR family transcriptional regulator [soil metagenome]